MDNPAQFLPARNIDDLMARVDGTTK